MEKRQKNPQAALALLKKYVKEEITSLREVTHEEKLKARKIALTRVFNRKEP